MATIFRVALWRPFLIFAKIQNFNCQLSFHLHWGAQLMNWIKWLFQPFYLVSDWLWDFWTIWDILDPFAFHNCEIKAYWLKLFENILHSMWWSACKYYFGRFPDFWEMHCIEISFRNMCRPPPNIQICDPTFLCGMRQHRHRIWADLTPYFKRYDKNSIIKNYKIINI